MPALAWCAGTGTVFPLVLIALPHPVGAAAAAAAALAGGALLLGWNGLYSTLITEAAGPGRAATAMGVSMTLLYTATVVAPPLFGWLVDHSSYAAGWAILTGVMAWATLAARRIPEPAGPAAPEP